MSFLNKSLVGLINTRSKKKSTGFPQKGIPYGDINLEMDELVDEIKSWNLRENLGSFHAEPDKIAQYVWKRLIGLNPNNLGNWSVKGVRVDGTTRVEKKLIAALIDLYGGKKDEWEGYVTSGGSEGNIFSVWLARQYLYPKKICLIYNDLTHYSILKAADICGVDKHLSNLNRKTWTFDLESLIAKLNSLSKKYKGFIVPLTLGYTQTGSNDDYLKISAALDKAEKRLDIKTFIYIDAALNGLVLPFSLPKFKPLKSKSVQTFLVDFHKAGKAPLPSGVILYRSPLRKGIERPIDYIEKDDSTLLGSRSGIPAASAWAIVESLGIRGFKKITRQRRQNKLGFIKEVKKVLPYVEIVDDVNSISMAIVTNKPLPKALRSKYGLYAKRQKISFQSGTEYLWVYKVAFLN